MKNKLSYKLIFYIFIISFSITSLALYINLKNTYESQVIKFEKDLNNIEKNRLEILSQSLWDVNQVAINIFLENLLNDEHIVYAKIIENDGNIYEFGEEKKEDIIKKEFVINKTFKDENYFIGKLIVIADLTPLKDKLQNDALNTILFKLIEIFLISLLIIFLIKKFITNSIEDMADYANNLTLDNLDTPLKIKNSGDKNNHNELDVVAHAINKMRINLIHQIEKSREKDTILAHQSKMAAMGEMIGNIAHQWRQPLSVISTAATGIKVNKELGIFDEATIIETMDAINESTQYLSTTIDDFRNFFKPEKDKKYFKISNVFNKTFSLIHQQFKNRDIDIIQDIKNAQILGFENELIQVLINILNNSRDELINLSNQKKLIFLNSQIKGNKLIIKIKDNAGGIKEDVINRIFEPYFTTKTKNLGTGIGLYICEEIVVKHMQGSIEVKNSIYTHENIEYKGAEFIIILNDIKLV